MGASGTYPPYGLSKFSTGDRPGMADWNNDNERTTEVLQSIEARAVSFSIRGLYPTLEALQDAHPTGQAGWAYAVGTPAANVVYAWDVDALAWINLGNLQGPQGPPGESEITLDTNTPIAGLLKGNGEKVVPAIENTDYAAALHAERHAAGGSDPITPASIGAYDKPLRFFDVIADGGEWEADETYDTYPHRNAVPLAGATADMIPDVVFGAGDAASGNFAPVVESYDGGIYLYAKTAPADVIQIPTITLWKGV